MHSLSGSLGSLGIAGDGEFCWENERERREKRIRKRRKL